MMRVLSAEQHAALIEAGGVWVAVKEARLAGFVAVENLPDAMHIWQMAVERYSQGHGLGRALLNTEMIWPVRSVYRRDVVWNAPFYAQAGFRILDSDTLQ